jgi:hypothetical protein
MDDLQTNVDGLAGRAEQETEGREEVRQMGTEGGSPGKAGEEQGSLSVGMASIPMSLIRAMADRREAPDQALSPEEEADRLLAAYADYARPNIFKPGQLVVPKRLGIKETGSGPFGVVLDADAVPASGDASQETLLIGRFLDGRFRTDVYDPLRFEPYVAVAGETSGQ